MKIAIDLGHGAKPYDGGAASEIANEEELIRLTAPWVSSELQRLGHEVKVIDIKKAVSVTDSLKQRVKAANSWGADLFVSQHYNSFNGDAYGAEVMADSAKGKQVAQAVVDAFGGLGIKNRGVKPGGHLFVIKYTRMPAILIEPAFIDNEGDMELLKKIGHEKLGKTIATAIDKAIDSW